MNKYTESLYTSNLLVLDIFTKQSEMMRSVAEQRFTLLSFLFALVRLTNRLASYEFAGKDSSFCL